MVQIEAPAYKAPMEAFERCRFKIDLIINKLQRQLDFRAPSQEIMSEMQERWISCYDDIYETDEQYLRYMFVVIKNRIRNMKKDSCRYQRMHLSDPTKLSVGCEDFDGGHVRVWNEMAVDNKEENPLINSMIRELIEKVKQNLPKEFHRQIFIRLIQGMPHKKIAEELKCSAGHVAKMKVDFIWPTVKDVMKISEDKYEVLIDSGRIYIRD